MQIITSKLCVFIQEEEMFETGIIQIYANMVPLNLLMVDKPQTKTVSQ